MGQFKPMVKMMTTEPTVELKLKKGGSVKKAMGGGMMGSPMDASMASSAPARGGMMPVARPKRPTMAARRAAMMGMKGMGGAMKEGGESKMKGLEKELKSHESKPASKGHKGLATGGVLKSTKPGNYATGGVVNGQGGYKKGGAIAKSGVIPESVSAKGGEGYKNTKMVTATPDNNSAPTGNVKLGNGGGYKKGGNVYDDDREPGSSGGSRGDQVGAPGGDKRGGAITKGGASKKHFATGGAVNDSGHAVAMPAKKPSTFVSNNRVSGTFKKGGKVMMSEGGTTDASKGAYDKSIGPSESDMDMAKAIRSVPRKLYEGAKSLFTSKDKPSGSVTKTEKSVTVTPARKRGGAVKC
jgi:hypothetical protein